MLQWLQHMLCCFGQFSTDVFAIVDISMTKSASIATAPVLIRLFFCIYLPFLSSILLFSPNNQPQFIFFQLQATTNFDSYFLANHHFVHLHIIAFPRIKKIIWLRINNAMCTLCICAHCAFVNDSRSGLRIPFPNPSPQMRRPSLSYHNIYMKNSYTA